jgi:hypothetical protein
MRLTPSLGSAHSDEMRGYSEKYIAEGCAFWVWPNSQIIIPLHRIKQIVVTKE